MTEQVDQFRQKEGPLSEGTGDLDRSSNVLGLKPDHERTLRQVRRCERPSDVTGNLETVRLGCSDGLGERSGRSKVEDPIRIDFHGLVGCDASKRGFRKRAAEAIPSTHEHDPKRSRRGFLPDRVGKLRA